MNINECLNQIAELSNEITRDVKFNNETDTDDFASHKKAAELKELMLAYHGSRDITQSDACKMLRALDREGIFTHDGHFNILMNK